MDGKVVGKSRLYHMKKKHHYSTRIKWIGNTGNGTKSYRDFERSHEICSPDKPIILGSSDPAFRGDKSKYNPEELLLASLSSCHMLWYLHLCATNNVNVIEYFDDPEGTMIETENGSGRFSEVVLRPRVTVSEKSMLTKAGELHAKANKFCFIANSVNFEVSHEPKCVVG